MKKALSLRLSDDVLQRVTKMAEIEHCSVTFVIERTLRNALLQEAPTYQHSRETVLKEVPTATLEPLRPREPAITASGKTSLEAVENCPKPVAELAARPHRSAIEAFQSSLCKEHGIYKPLCQRCKAAM
jgi:hypothetical protein